MKKITRIAALLAAGALLFGAVGCSGDDDGDPPAKTLEGIRITTDNTVKTQYDVGAELDLRTGVKVTAEYSDKSEENVTDRADITATYKDEDKPFTTNATGIFKVTLAAAYEGKEAALEAPITINVGVKLVSISMEVVAVDEVKVTYKQGEPIDSTGIKVTAHYDDESESVLSNSEVEFTATYKDGDEDKPFDTSFAPGKYDNVTLIATYKGKTAKLPAPPITIEKNDPPPEETDPDPTEKTYAWDFQAADLTTAIDTNPLEAKVTYESTPAGLTLVFPEGFKNNQLAPAYSVSSTVIVGASNGTIQPNGGSDGVSDMYVEVQGPFTVTMLCSANGSKDADRTAYIKINGEEKATTGDTVLAAGNKLTTEYKGTEVVKVSFGGTDYFRLFDIEISTKNGDGEGKTAGEVKSSAVFDDTKSETVENKEDPLGLVGTELSVEPRDVVRAEFDEDNENIVIKPLKKGSATITVKNDSGNEATIDVTVSSTGTITTKITPYEDTSGIFTIENGVLNLMEDKYEYYLSMENLQDTSGNNAWSSVNATNNGNSKKANAPFDTAITAFDMKSSNNRAITLKVKNVAAIDVYATGGSDRVYQVAVNNTTAGEDGKADGSGYRFTTGTQDEATIVISTTSSNSVYPIGVILYKTAPATEE